MAIPPVPDRLWTIFASVLPPLPPTPRRGRPPWDDRLTFAGICFVLESGCCWYQLPGAPDHPSGTTCWRRLRDWQAAGVWAAFHLAMLDRLDEQDLLQLAHLSIDSSTVPAKKGGPGTRTIRPTTRPSGSAHATGGGPAPSAI